MTKTDLRRKRLARTLRALKFILIFPTIILITFLVLSGSKDWAEKIREWVEA